MMSSQGGGVNNNIGGGSGGGGQSSALKQAGFQQIYNNQGSNSVAGGNQPMTTMVNLQTQPNQMNI